MDCYGVVSCPGVKQMFGLTLRSFLNIFTIFLSKTLIVYFPKEQITIKKVHEKLVLTCTT